MVTNKPRKIKNLFNERTTTTIITLIFSGLSWFLGNELYGNFWYLLWFAPIPVLLLSFNAKGKFAFVIAYIAYTIGRLSWFTYLQETSSLSFAIILTLFLPLIFSIVLIAVRRIVVTSQTWLSVFAFPVLFTASEFIMLNVSPEGSSSSLAYTQMNFLPVIQIASVTGILGITFIITFIPSVIAVGWHFRFQKSKFFLLTIVSAFFIIGVLLFGIFRINNKAEINSFKAGLVSLNEQNHDASKRPDSKKSLQTIHYYADAISKLADSGAQLIVAPERAINIDTTINVEAISILSKVARQKHVYLIMGYTNIKSEPERNSALVINTNGDVIVDYHKVHLIDGLEYRFTPGNKMGLFTFNDMQAGVAICKDLDYPDYINKYGKIKISFMVVPAWDFVINDWLHSRMTILRGVENGFSIIRTTRQGRLTISNCYGRVCFEKDASNGEQTFLFGKVSIKNTNTLYANFGNWFGILNAVVALLFIFEIIRKRKKQIIYL
ncbi:MAG: nitrilase-related carbon-nitrogen hydrolase [Ferruginibacter sp.]